MSSSPTGATSTTASSTSWPSPAEPEAGTAAIALIACGAIAQPGGEIVAARGWGVDVFPLPPLLHNQPQLIAGQVDRLAAELEGRYSTVAVGYADCGTCG